MRNLVFKYIIVLIVILINVKNSDGVLSQSTNNISEEVFNLYFEKGKKHFINKEYRKAVKEWDYLIENKTLNDELKKMLYECYRRIYEAEQYYVKGMEYFKNNNLLESERNFMKATNICPEYERAKDMLLLVEKYIGIENDLKLAHKYLETKQYNKTIEICKNILKLQPDNRRAQKLIEQALLMINNDKIMEEINNLIAKGITLFSNREYQASKSVFNDVLKLDPENFVAIKYIDKINQILVDIREMELLKEEAEKYYQAGIGFYNIRKYNEALKQFQNTVALIPDYKDSSEYIDRIKQKLKELELAKQREKESLILEYLSQGITYYYNSEYKMAIAMLEKCLKLDPENEYAIQYLQKAKEALFQKEEEYISEDSPYYELYVKLKRKALYYYDIGDYPESLKWWEKVLNLFPSNKEAREMAIVITLKLDREKATEFLALHFEAGKNFLRNNEYKTALKEFEMIHKIDPEYQNVKEYIDKTREYLKKPPVVKLPVEVLKQYYENGLKYYKEKKYDLAIAEWKKILKDNSPENPYRVKAIVNINKIKRKMRFASVQIKEEKPKTDKYKEIVNKHYLKGIAFYVKGRYREAIKEWQIVLKYEPNHINAKNNIEKCKRKIEFAR